MAGATFALGAAVGLGAVTGALGATGAAAFVLTGFDLVGTTPVLFWLLPVLRAAGAALVFTTDLGDALVEALTGALVTALTAFWVTALAGAFTTVLVTALLTALAGVLFLATLLTGAVGLACTFFLAAAALAKVVFAGIAAFFFGVVTSCLLTV